MLRIVFVLLLTSSLGLSAAWPTEPPAAPPSDDQASIRKLMIELRTANKKMKWNPSIFVDDGWQMHGLSVDGRPLIYWTCGDKSKNTTLMLSSVHGDEITPVYFGFRLVSWAKGEPNLCKDYRIVVAPLVNPDGFLKQKPTRTNAHGIDINRNFPTKDFAESALKIWAVKHHKDPRNFPGDVGGSEPETKFQQWLIETFSPSKILTVHAPLNFYDYDGPDDSDFRDFSLEYITSCDRLRHDLKEASDHYNFLRYGFFPGSLGNYAGKERGIPTLTLELPTIDAHKARAYFERLKAGTRRLVTYRMADPHRLAESGQQ